MVLLLKFLLLEFFLRNLEKEWLLQQEENLEEGNKFEIAVSSLGSTGSDKITRRTLVRIVFWTLLLVLAKTSEMKKQEWAEHLHYEHQEGFAEYFR